MQKPALSSLCLLFRVEGLEEKHEDKEDTFSHVFSLKP